jgi:hypothetical protein
MEELTLGQIVTAIADVGLPIAITVYLLVRGVKTIDKFTDALVEVRLALALILDRLDLKAEYEEAVREIRNLRKRERDK